MNLVRGKTALVTGGAAGIGACIAERLAQQGAKQVAVVDINIDGANKLAEQLTEKYDCEFIAIKASVADEKDVLEAFEIVKRRMGHLDILVNNAGVGGIVPIDDLTTERWKRTYDINVMGSFLFAREAIKIMKTQGGGRIINMASQAGKIGGMVIGMDYSTSKGAILTLTKSLAKVCAQYNITVNSVAPGLIATEMTNSFDYDPAVVPIGRIGTTDEVADVVLFAASDLSRYMTGACLDVNGGMSMW